MPKRKLFYLIIISILLDLSLNFKESKAGYLSYVAGTVIDERNFPLQNIKVIINGVETDTDKFGKFRLLNVPSPYDVTIADKNSSTAVIYKDINIDNPELVLFGAVIDKNLNAAFINVKFPEIPVKSTAILKFISQDDFSSRIVEAYSGDNNKTIPVYWPQTKSSISGKIIFIQKDTYEYESFIEKNITVSKSNIPVNTNLKSGNAVNPKTSSIIVNSPEKNYAAKNISVYADFTDFSENSGLLLYNDEGKLHSVKCIIPELFPFSGKYLVKSNIQFKNGSGYETNNFVKPNGRVTIQNESPPEPQTPTDNFLGADGNTEFYYSLGSGTGVYIVQFKSVNTKLNFYIVTKERSTRLNYLSRDEFRRSGSVEFRWRVNKYLTYFSVDDFVKPSVFKNDIGYKAILYSQERTFKTGYY
ncbi:MAG TPA: carboxypeptidase-like regulatory domain-containing protein [Ignavibacteria bacterium]|nr:carboxypeptidase-like regulatory domain-containing protein [Ignavibacteria bacterium]HMR39507.1 carboxypeptidase-like regulatory domain-containing protein [Ignavibacteria bacterium]